MENKKENIMNKRLIRLMILVCATSLLIGCSKENATSKLGNEYSLEYDDQYYFENHVIAKSKDGYYINYDAQQLYYMSDTAGLILVCAKPECNHQGEDCFAQMFEEGEQVYYYNNKLYFVTLDVNTLEYWLYECNLDGTEQNKLTYLFTQGENGIVYSVMLHRGYAYYEVSNHSLLDNGKRELYRIELKKNAEKEIVDTVEGYGSSFLRVQGDGEYIYYEKANYTDQQGTEFQTSLNRYHCNTKKVEEVYEQSIYDYYIENDEVYFSDLQGVNKLNMTSKEVVSLVSFSDSEEDYNMYYDGTYIYLDNKIAIQSAMGERDDSERKIHIYDKKGSLINTLEIGNRNGFIAGDEKYLFLLNNWEQPEGTNAIVSIIDKSNIATGQLEWIHLEGE